MIKPQSQKRTGNVLTCIYDGHIQKLEERGVASVHMIAGLPIVSFRQGI
jgi:hypothetical protein